LGSGIAKNPYLSFWIQGAKAGNQVVVSWVDSTGDKNSAETMIV
jgi:sulfur-oxidizing protein SoxZ